MSETAILILAAGASARMGGRDKLLEPVAGRALLRRQVEAALATGAPVVVTLPPGADARRAALAGLALRCVEVPDAAEGMAASLRAGVAALPADADAVMVVLADMPEIGAAALAAMLKAGHAAPGAILRATAPDGTPGHPVIFPRRLFPELGRLSGDRGARDILKAQAGRVVAVPLPGDQALTDLDTPEDWAAWRAKTGL
ncbi:nucleotidyltransferase family protein [Rhodovulum iodosum]